MNNHCVCCKNWAYKEITVPYTNGKMKRGSVCVKYGNSSSAQHCDNFELGHITPEQFKERTGQDYPDDCAVYVVHKDYIEVDIYRGAKEYQDCLGHNKIILLCTFPASPVPESIIPLEDK